jgi:multidrug efflux pump subunit AcrA (membrane-fusion protein)
MKGIEFETALPVKWINQVHIGDSYQLKLHHNQQLIAATVSHIVPSANRITQMCQLKLSLPESVNLESGLSGQIDFIIAKEKHRLIPASALIKKAGVQGVFRLDLNQKVFFTPVKIERAWRQYQVVLSGLQVGEKLVTNPTTALRDGMFVKVAEQ